MTASRLVAVMVSILLLGGVLFAQSESATLSGQILDQSKSVIARADIEVVNIDTGVSVKSRTNEQGIYVIPNLKPGNYRLSIHKAGFRSIEKLGIVLHVQDYLSDNFTMQIGSATESITVEGSTPVVNTQDGAVSTVIDRNFADNLPLNGRSFQSLIQLTPGVVLTSTSNGGDTGQFSVNGQRAASNYWTVDGVAANLGMSVGFTTGNGLGGSLGTYSVFGGTNSLVSVDALQEFRIQTSTFAPEFGRTPGGQISISTRSGTNRFHGSIFDYLRNDVLDANDWFADNQGLPKPRERQNDFGGTFSGPVFKDRTFFFASYEGLRLALPRVALSFVPDLVSRQAAIPAMRPFLNAFPVPNGTVDPIMHVGQFNASFSNPGSLDAYSLRLDHKLTNKVSIFGRYNYSPSDASQRGLTSTLALNSVGGTKILVQTVTAGMTWTPSSHWANDVRFNYSSTDSSSRFKLDNFGGGAPLTSLPLPSSETTKNGRFGLTILGAGNYLDGNNSANEQRQINIIDSASTQMGSHLIKVGIDFRRLTPVIGPFQYSQVPIFLNVSQAVAGTPIETFVQSTRNPRLDFRNVALFAQDTWRVNQRLSLTYGLRWDVDFAPSTLEGPDLPAVTGFDFNNLSQLAIAPAGTPAYKTEYTNIAPRLGVAWQVFQRHEWETVLRGGFGVFYDLASTDAGNIVNVNSFPFGASNFVLGPFPINAANAAPPPIVPPATFVASFDPNLNLPYTLQWNGSIEQALGLNQSFTVTYVGAVGRRLLQTAEIIAPNPDLQAAELLLNGATSDYHALQLQFRRRLTNGLQALSNYTWSHAIDSASGGSLGSGLNSLASATQPNLNRGPSSFDVRQAFSTGLTYMVPSPHGGPLMTAILKGWSTDNIFQASSAAPIDVSYQFVSPILNNFVTEVRPNLVPGQSLYLFGSNFPGGKALNPAAFTGPAANVQGNLPRNALRGFGDYQWDFAVHRDFPIHEQVTLQFRAEMFNVLNHPNFGPPDGNLGSPDTLNPLFGKASQMLGPSLGGATGAGGLDPLYEIGGPRSIQFALKLTF